MISVAGQEDDLTHCRISCEESALADANLHIAQAVRVRDRPEYGEGALGGVISIDGDLAFPVAPARPLTAEAGASAGSAGGLLRRREDAELGASRLGGFFHLVTHEAHRRTP
ncbi:hypothetical protein Misp02_33430 [Microtetraspora sp. NBRC 16547]|nr:hypothetical protein Misp02_33430 [Microtetraspora sp. NBRC 16547]